MASANRVNFAPPRGFISTFKSDCRETFFPDDPFKQFSDDKPLRRARKALQYFVPIFGWLPSYNFRLFRYDLLAGMTITSLAIPQGISYAKLGSIPPIIGLYSSFLPPIVYAIFGSSKYLAVGTLAACTLLIAETLGEKASPTEQPTLYLHLVFTTAFVTGVIQAALGFLRLGILVDFLSHSTITGFMGGTAVIISLQQMKGMLGLVKFTNKTDVISVLHSIFENRAEWRWQSAVVGVCFLIFLQVTRCVSKRNPKLFWVSAVAPMISVAAGCLFAYLADIEKHGIQIVGELKKGLNPISIQFLNFNPEFLPAVLKAGTVTGLVALAEGIAVGRSFAVMRNEQTDGNKEMIALGLMNIFGSFASCYLTSGPFSKTAVNFNAGARTAMSNIVMAISMMLVLLFLAPLFSYTPIVALSAIIMSAMLGLIKYEKFYHLFVVDKFDFCIAMTAFLGVAFLSMDVGISLSVLLAIIRGLLYVARPAPCKLGRLPNSNLYRDTEQYPGVATVPGILILQLGSPVYYANVSYIKERVMRWIREEQSISNAEDDVIEHLLIDLTGVSSIDLPGIDILMEIRRAMQRNGIKTLLINPRLEVLEKFTLSHFVDTVGKESIFLCIEDAVEACRFSLNSSKEKQLATIDDSTNDEDNTASTEVQKD